MALSATITVNGDAIRQRRMALGLTLQGFAPTAQISYQYLSQLERGSRQRVTPPTFRRLVAALDMVERSDELVAAA